MKLKNIYTCCYKIYQVLDSFVLSDNSCAVSVGKLKELGAELNYISDIHFLESNVSEIMKIDEKRLSSESFKEEIPLQIIEPLKRLKSDCKKINDLCESLGYSFEDIASETEKMEINIKLPKYNDFGELVSIIKNVDFIFYQCPFLNQFDLKIKFSRIDVGSSWFDVILNGSGIIAFVTVLGKMIKMALDLRDQYIRGQIQIEELRNKHISNRIIEDMSMSFENVLKEMTSKCVEELQEDFILKDGEEKGKAEESLNRLYKMMSLGLQMHVAIEDKEKCDENLPTEEEQKSIELDEYIKLIDKLKKIESDE